MSKWRGDGEDIVVSFGLHNEVVKERKRKIHHQFLEFNRIVPMNLPICFGSLVLVAHFS